jgi:hypothetical protein
MYACFLPKKRKQSSSLEYKPMAHQLLKLASTVHSYPYRLRRIHPWMPVPQAFINVSNKMNSPFHGLDSITIYFKNLTTVYIWVCWVVNRHCFWPDFHTIIQYPFRLSCRRKMKASRPVLISVMLVFASIILRCAYSADPDPVRDFETGLTTFTLRNIFENGDVTHDTGGIRAVTSPLNFPAVRYIKLNIFMWFLYISHGKCPRRFLFLFWY